MTPLLVEVRALERRFGSRTALQPLSFELSRGDMWGITGPGGSGKSILISILAGFMKSSAGHVRVLGERPGSPRLRGRVGVFCQRACLPRFETVSEFLEHLARLHGRDPMASVGEVVDLLKLRESSRLRCEEVPLSVAKRVGLAAALIGHPEVLLLDEPTLGLPSEDAELIRSLLRSACQQMAVVLVSADQTDLVDCDEVMHLADIGSAVARGGTSTPFGELEEKGANSGQPRVTTLKAGNIRS